MPGSPADPRPDLTDRQVVDVVVDRGYRPKRITARAGRPLRLVFRLHDADPRSARVVFSEPRLNRLLEPAGTTIIDLPARGPGVVRFTCGMGRYRGRIAFVDERASSHLAQIRARAARLRSPLVTALAWWIVPFPLIALIGAITFDLATAGIAAGAALGVWLVSSLWVFGRRGERI